MPAASEPQTMDRRRVLSLARNGGIAAAVLGGTGLFGVRSVMATVAEHDLTRVGQGKPAIVQVHDPQCPTCTALQRETRRALDSFEECDLVYLVANIRTVDGSSFANTHRAPHVTLLLFDAHGTLRQSLNGMRYRQELREVFRAHHAAYGSV
ncbi:MAG: hypothetical protein QNJ16_21575 [Rhodobacter sp.]|nr:hypothetical protein [Rhodobacter sp.]